MDKNINKAFTSKQLADMRQQYKGALLDLKTSCNDPFLQFTTWFEQALHSETTEPNAMILTTANSDGVPSARTVLLKSYDRGGFIFFTNYTSRKAEDIESNPKVELLFYWPGLNRQVRIGGSVTKISSQQSDEYFASRPTGSKYAAWASPQSHTIESRADLEECVKKIKEKFPNENKIPRPLFWGGFRVFPVTFEFWQGQPDRLHDRIRYNLIDDCWKIERLAP